jgi:hypothetical protein
MAEFLRQIREDEEGTLARLMAHRRDLVEPEIAEHRGRASFLHVESSANRTAPIHVSHFL